MNSKVYSSIKNVSSNHWIFSANIHLCIYRNKKEAGKAALYDSSSLANSDISNELIVSVRNKFDTLQETFERYAPNDVYENFVITK